MAKRRKNPADSSTLLTLGLFGVAGYFIYEWFFATPTAAAPASTASTGTAPVTTTPAATTTATTTPATTTSAAPTSGTLDSIYTQMLALIVQYADPNFTIPGTTGAPTTASSNITGTPFHFDVYLALAAPGSTIPDPGQVFGSATAADAQMTAAAYWAVMGPALKTANPGLSGLGLGVFAGIGAYLHGLGAYGWN